MGNRSLYKVQDKKISLIRKKINVKNTTMKIYFTREQELAAQRLHEILPLLQPARISFTTLCWLANVKKRGNIETSSIHAALELAKAVLKLEHDLKLLLTSKSPCTDSGAVLVFVT